MNDIQISVVEKASRPLNARLSPPVQGIAGISLAGTEAVARNGQRGRRILWGRL